MYFIRAFGTLLVDGTVKSNAFLDRVSLSPGTGQLDQYFSLLQEKWFRAGKGNKSSSTKKNRKDAKECELKTDTSSLSED